MQKISIIVGLVLCLSVLAVPSSAVELGVRGYYWFPGLSGDVSYDGDDVSGTELDLEDDLGMESESYPMVEVFAGFGAHHLSFTYYKADYTGSETIEEEIVFGDTVFAADLDVDSSLELTVMDFAYQWDLIDLENVLAGGSIGLVGKVKYLDITASLESDIGDEEADISLPIPMLGANLHLGILLNMLEARVQVTGMGYSGNSVVEILGDISYTPFPFMDIHAGYRSFVMSADEDDVEANLAIAGPYAALTIGF